MTPQRELFIQFTLYNGLVEFGDQGELLVTERGTIQVRIRRYLQIMRDVLYVPGISVNLLSIIALDRREYTVIFGGQSVKIVDKHINKTVARGYVSDGLYELTDCKSDRAFVTQEIAVQKQTAREQVSQKAMEQPARNLIKDYTSRKIFELVHQRLGHVGMYRLKDLHQHVSGIEAFDVPSEFEYKVCDASKIIRTINRKPRTKTTVPKARLYTDFWGPFLVGSIIGGYTLFVLLIDEATGRVSLRPLVSKGGVYDFLLNNVKLLLTEGYMPVVTIRTNNVREYQSTEKELMNMGVTIEFTSTYTAYQNRIIERFNRTVITLARAMLI